MPRYEYEPSNNHIPLIPRSPVPDVPPRNDLTARGRVRESQIVEKDPLENAPPDSCSNYCKACCHCSLLLIVVSVALIAGYHYGLIPLIIDRLQVEESRNNSIPDARDPCPTGYFLFSQTRDCYKAVPYQTVFEDAEAECQKDGAHLTSIHSELENIFVIGLYHEAYLESRRTNENPSGTKYDYWIGLIRSNGRWSWLDGSPVEFRNWNSRDGIEDRSERWAFIRATGMTWLRTRMDKKGFVCKKPSSHGASDVAVTEIIPCKNGYFWLQSTKSCYKYQSEKSSFENAMKACSDEDAKLVSIHSLEESIFLRGLVNRAIKENKSVTEGFDAWIGLTHSNRHYQWSDGSPVNYTDWDVAEPDHANGFDYTVMPYWRGWKSTKPSEYGFICKK